MMGWSWNPFFIASHLAAAIACAILAVWMVSRSDHPRETMAAGAAFALTSFWCLVAAATAPLPFWTLIAESARNLGLLFLIYRLFGTDGRSVTLDPIRPVMTVLVVLELLQPILLLAGARFGPAEQAGDLVFHIGTMFRLLVAVGALMLVHNLYVGASATNRIILRWPSAALALVWIYDLNFYTVAYLGDSYALELAAMRGLVIFAVAVMFAIGVGQVNGDLRFKPSRKVTFQTLSLVIIGGYLVAMVAISQAIALIGGDLARLSQVGFVFVASVGALLWLPSEHMRRWLKVTAVKHLFQHRYDYRAEWLRFTNTIGRTGDNTAPLHERVIKAVADIADSPGGLLLIPNDQGRMELAARWQWEAIEVPAEAMPASTIRLIEEKSFIFDVDEIRRGTGNRDIEAVLPDWILREDRAWALVPLLHFERLVGLVLLARPAMVRKLDWEDFDLLRVVGQQLASYLAEKSGQEALDEASRFDEFNRRIAFVMHDIKNLASQLSLLARNAEKHADKPAFRADMLVTLRNSADKLNGLLARLGRYGTPAGESLQPLVLGEGVREFIKRFEAVHPVILVETEPCKVLANKDSLEQALVHLVQNAIEASEPGAPVFLRVINDGLNGLVEIVDSGCGMSPDFVRSRLFKPFVSSKQDGFGIGAFEARELIGAMRGRLEVESREGLGTRFFIRLPRADAAGIFDKIGPIKSEVA